jgi:hypothetical protein
MLTRTEAQTTLLHTPDVRDDEGHKPAVFNVEGTPEEKVAFLVTHLTTVSAQNLALEIIRRAQGRKSAHTRMLKIDRALGEVHEAISVAAIASGEFVR